MFSAFLVGSIVAVNMGSVLAAVQFTGVNIAGYDMLSTRELSSC